MRPGCAQVVSAPDTSATAGKFDFSGFKDGDLWIALITFLYVDFLVSEGQEAARRPWRWQRQRVCRSSSTAGSCAGQGLCAGHCWLLLPAA